MIVDAAYLHLQEVDGMRWLGADPTGPADDIERLVAVALQTEVVRIKEAASGR